MINVSLLDERSEVLSSLRNQSIYTDLHGSTENLILVFKAIVQHLLGENQTIITR